MKHKRKSWQILPSLSNIKLSFPLKCRFYLKEEKEEKQHLIHIHVDVNFFKGTDKMLWRRGMC